jgi:long-chain acyl-CoA synthetase
MTIATAAPMGRTSQDEALAGNGYGSLSVATILASTALRSAERPAVSWAGTTISYGSLWDETRAYAAVLRSRGVTRGDRGAVLIPNVPDFPRVYYAVLSLGAVVVPIHLLFKHEEIEFVLRDSGAVLLVAAAPMLGEGAPAAAAAGIPILTVLLPDEMIAAVPLPRFEDEAKTLAPIDGPEPVNPLDAATILYTSGTTGRPKGAVGSHLAIVEQVNTALVDMFDSRRDDVVFGGLPLFHTFGQTSVMNTTFRRGGHVLLLAKFDGSSALEMMVDYAATVFTGVPTMFIALLQAAAETDLRPPLRYAISGGSALPISVLEAFQASFHADVHEGYGLTETSPVISFNHTGEPLKPGTVGRPIWGVEAEIADADLETSIRILPRGELGEIVVRGHNLFKGYLGNPEATTLSMVDGWFRTGDLGTKDEDDYLTIVDRKKDMIVRNGYNVYPSEVEDVLMRHPGIVSIAVFGVPDDVHGQEVHAAVVARGPEVTSESIIDFAREHLAAYKYPRQVHLVTDLPLGASGKVLKRKLVDSYADQAKAGVHQSNE